MHVSSSEKFQVVHCTCSKNIDEKYRQSVCSAVCYFAVNIPLFFHNCIPFRSRSRPVFSGSGSSSGSEQTVSTAPAPAPTKMCRLRRLRLRLRLRIPDLNIKKKLCLGGPVTGLKDTQGPRSFTGVTPSTTSTTPSFFVIVRPKNVRHSVGACKTSEQTL